MARNTANSHFHPKDCRYCGAPLELVRKQVVYPAAPAKAMILHIPADHEHQFRFNVNTISGPM